MLTSTGQASQPVLMHDESTFRKENYHGRQQVTRVK